MIFLNCVQFPCTLTSRILIHVNKVTRLYIVLHITLRIIIFKFLAVSEELELTHRSEELSKKEEDELNFMRRFSHYTRTALNGIVNFSYFLRSGVLNSLRYKDSGKIEGLETMFSVLSNATNMINRQTKDLTDYFLIQSDKFQLSVTPKMSNLSNVINYVLKVEKSSRLELDKSKKDKLILECHIEPKLPKKVFIDENRLTQVLMNVVSNSIKFTDSGSVVLKVDFDEDPTKFLITIQDTGIGITEDGMKLIYEPFASCQRNPKRPGFSIGLFITKSIVEGMKGSIDIISEGRNKGTFVELRFPLKMKISEKKSEKTEICGDGEDEKEEEEEEEEESKKEDSSEEDSSSSEFDDSSMYKRKVTPVSRKCYDLLIVEDNVVNMEVFRKQAHALTEGRHVLIYNVESADTALGVFDSIDYQILQENRDKIMKGAHPVELFRENYERYPCVITDIEMPVMDGTELCRELRKRYGQNVIVYAVTATFVGSKKHYCERFMFDGVSQKPVPIHEMKKIMIDIFEQREMIGREKRLIESKSRFSETSVFPEKEKEKPDYRNWWLITTNISHTLFVILLDQILKYFSPGEFKSGWRNFTIFDAIMSSLQFILFYFFRYPVSVLSLLTCLRHLVVCILASEVCMFQLIQSMYMCFVGMIIFANKTVQSRILSFLISVLWLIQIFYYELSRPNDYFYLMEYNQFLNLCNWFTFLYFVVMIVFISHILVHGIEVRKKLLLSLVKLKVELERKINETLSKISHDLTTPSAVLIYFVKALRENESDLVNKTRESKVQFQMIERCICNLDFAIRNFMLCCKYKNGKIVSNFRGMNFPSFVKGIFEEYDCFRFPNISKNFIKKNEELDNADKLYLDFVNLESVISNLYVNCLKHSQTSRICISHEIYVYDERFLFIVVEDFGTGIPFRKEKKIDEDIEEPSDFHFRETFSNKMGLGITVCKALVKEMGGCIKFRCGDNNIGTKVEILIPFSLYPPNDHEGWDDEEGDPFGVDHEEDFGEIIDEDGFITIIDDDDDGSDDEFELRSRRKRKRNRGFPYLPREKEEVEGEDDDESDDESDDDEDDERYYHLNKYEFNCDCSTLEACSLQEFRVPAVSRKRFDGLMCKKQVFRTPNECRIRIKELVNKPLEEVRVLVVDDIGFMNTINRYYLRSLKFMNIFESTNREGTLDVLRKEKIDLLFIDLCINGESAFEILLDLGKEWMPALVFLVTGFGVKKENCHGLIDCVLSKPTNKSLIKSALEIYKFKL